MTTFITVILLSELLDIEGLDHILDLDLEGALGNVLIFELWGPSLKTFITDILLTELLDIEGLKHVLDLDLDLGNDFV